jgi:transcriptional regulator with XRE-family HTH domain
VKDSIRAARKRIGLSQVMLAERMHVTQSAVSHWERGESMPTAKQIPLLADILQISVDELFRKKVG